MSALAFLTKEFWGNQSRAERDAASAAITAADEDTPDATEPDEEAPNEEAVVVEEAAPEQEQAALQMSPLMATMQRMEARLTALEGPATVIAGEIGVTAEAKAFADKMIAAGTALPFNADGYAKAFDILGNVVAMAKASGNEDAVHVTDVHGATKTIQDVFCAAVCPDDAKSPLLEQGAMAGKTRGASIYGASVNTHDGEFAKMSDADITALVNNATGGNKKPRATAQAAA